MSLYLIFNNPEEDEEVDKHEYMEKVIDFASKYTIQIYVLLLIKHVLKRIVLCEFFQLISFDSKAFQKRKALYDKKEFNINTLIVYKIPVTINLHPDMYL